MDTYMTSIIYVCIMYGIQEEASSRAARWLVSFDTEEPGCLLLGARKECPPNTFLL